MKFVILIGPQAVGKMTIGQELQKLSGLKLFHNHMAIELVAPFFSYGTPEGRGLVNRIRQEFFNAFVENGKDGYIFTYMWAFGEPGQQEYIEGISDHFENNGYETYWIELEADLDERIKRNRTDNRLRHKPTKRDTSWSEKNLLESSEKYRLYSNEGEITRSNYLRIENSRRSAIDVAEEIWDFVSAI